MSVVRNPAWRDSLRAPSTSYHALPLPFLRVKVARTENRPKPLSRAEKKTQREQVARKRKEEARERERIRATTEPHPIYGHVVGLGTKTPDSVLHRAILDRHQVWGIGEEPLDPRMVTPTLTDGFEHAEAEKKVEAPTLKRWVLGAQTEQASTSAAAELPHNSQVDSLRRLVDLRNASSKEIQRETVRRIIEAFAVKEGDTGSLEIKIALLTYRLLRTFAYLQDNPKALPERELLRKLHAQRRNFLRRLAVYEPERFKTICQRCGIDERAAIAKVVFVRTGKVVKRKRMLAARPPAQYAF